MIHTLPTANWAIELARLISNCADGDTIEISTQAAAELGERARQRMCPEKRIVFALKAKAHNGYANQIVVSECPYCHQSHRHNPPLGDGQRMADCGLGEYILDFGEAQAQPEG